MRELGPHRIPNVGVDENHRGLLRVFEHLAQQPLKGSPDVILKGRTGAVPIIHTAFRGGMRRSQSVRDTPGATTHCAALCVLHPLPGRPHQAVRTGRCIGPRNAALSARSAEQRPHACASACFTPPGSGGGDAALRACLRLSNTAFSCVPRPPAPVLDKHQIHVLGDVHVVAHRHVTADRAGNSPIAAWGRQRGHNVVIIISVFLSPTCTQCVHLERRQRRTCPPAS